MPGTYPTRAKLARQAVAGGGVSLTWLAVTTFAAKTLAYAALIGWNERREQQLPVPPNWEVMMHGSPRPAWWRALEYELCEVLALVLLYQLLPQWVYPLWCLIRLPMWYVRLSRGNARWRVGPSVSRGNYIEFDMTGDPAPPLYRRNAALGALLSLLCDLPLLQAG